MGVFQVPQLLACIALCGLPGGAAGPHSLCYSITVRSQDGFVHMRFFAEGLLDDEPFLCYDSEKDRAEPCGPKAQKVLGDETRETVAQVLAERGKMLKMFLADINALQELKGGSHSLQETWCCQIQEDNRIRCSWEFHYDGEPFLSYHPETHSWTVHPSSAKDLAVKVKEHLEKDPTQNKASWAYVWGDVYKTLQGYQRSSMDLKIQTVPPAVNVTSSEAFNGTVNRTSEAFDFYPGNLSPRSVANIVIIIAAAAVIIIGLCVYFWKKRRTACSAGGSDLRSQQVLDQQLLAQGDPTGTTQLELQPRSAPCPSSPVLMPQFP